MSCGINSNNFAYPRITLFVKATSGQPLNIPQKLFFREKTSSCPESPKYIKDVLFSSLHSVSQYWTPFCLFWVPLSFINQISALSSSEVTHSKTHIGSVQTVLTSAVVMRDRKPCYLPIAPCSSENMHQPNLWVFWKPFYSFLLPARMLVFPRKTRSTWFPLLMYILSSLSSDFKLWQAFLLTVQIYAHPSLISICFSDCT